MQTMTQSARRRVIWGLSLHGWEEAMRWSLAGAGIFALIVGVSTYFVVSLQREEIAANKIEFEKYKVDATKEVQSVRSDSDAKIKIASEQAGAETAKANARAAEADQKAAEAQLALEQFRAPRTVSADQQERIADALKPFAGTKFDAAALQDTEAILFLAQIEDALIAAGWTAIDWAGMGITYSRPNRTDIGNTPVIGVVIGVELERLSEHKAPAEALVNALLREGIAVKGAAEPLGALNSNPQAIHVFVGRKE